ncbi:probable Nucleoporin POM152 [Zygosaccharomyces bailii]|nr:probable Nucleoporin POM152 [Zygosaccharomyces bailii]
MDRDFLLNTATPRGNHWIGATSSYRSHVDTSAQRRFQPSTSSKEAKFNNLPEMKAKRSKDDIEVNPNSLPLISPEVLDVSRQRFLAFLVFLIIQGYKAYDLFLLKSGLPVVGLGPKSYWFNFISKYVVIDAMFLYFLPSFKIPKLTFPPWVICLQTVFMWGFTLFVSTEHDFTVITGIVTLLWRFNNKEMSLSGSSVSHRRLLDSSSHFKGAMTIKILPENTAMLNPFHESYCLPVDTNLLPEGHLKIPVRINSTAGIQSIQLEYRDLYTNEIELRNLTAKDFKVVNDPAFLLNKDHALAKGITESESIRYVELPLSQVGFYQIKRIIDSKNLSLKVYQSHLIISHCPVATILGTGSFDRCIGDSDKLSIELQGVPPMRLGYSKTVDGQKYTYMDSNLQPEYFESPLQSTPKHSFLSGELENLKWARTYPVTINLDLPVTQEGFYNYKIDSLVDGLGNVMDFRIIPESVKSAHGVSYNFKVHGIPRASLEEKFDPNSSTKKSILVKFESIQDWQAAIPYWAKLTHVAANGETHSFNLSTNSLTHDFQAELPGSYKLDSVQSKFCPGVVIGKSNVLVTKPIPPELEVKSTPILDQCVGQVGLNFDLTFTGIPPFHYRALIYRIERGKRDLYDTKRYTSQGTRNQFNYNPTTEGNYEIVFDDLSNQLFTDPISLVPREKYTFKTSMRVKPSAVFKSTHKKKLCLGDHTNVPVQFNGEPPFTINYDILETSSNKRETFIEDNIESNDFSIGLPSFNMGGDYIVSLVSVKDFSGCVVSLSEPDVMIQVRRDVPSASFNLLENANSIKIKQGSFAEIPIKLAGEAPFTVKFQHLDYEGTVLGVYESRFNTNYKPSLNLNKEGFYKLIEVYDSYCMGKIENVEFQFEISFLDKPFFSVVENSKTSKLSALTFTKEQVCQGTESAIDLVLSGSPPFILEYAIIAPNGYTASDSIQVATRYATIKLPNEEAGEYTAVISGLFDTNYGESDFTKAIPSETEVLVRQTVNPSPYITFADLGKTFRTCSINVQEDASSLEPIKLKFIQGKPPFSITFSVYHESKGRSDQFTLNNVESTSFPYYKLYENLKLGNHVVSIEKIMDANGCINDMIGAQDNHILISITDVPKIHLLDPTAEYCVGDYVAYQLNGVAPFSIRYEFNEKQLKLKEHTSQFVRIASEPGTISIVSLKDSISQCVVNFTHPAMKKEFEKLSLLVHPLPSVTVSRGKNLIEDIHEGDQAEIIFTFEGNPPFSLTYVRTEEAEGSEGRGIPQVVETHKVTDIYAYEYRVVTSLQGTYQAIEVSDAFCFAKNDAYFSS